MNDDRLRAELARIGGSLDAPPALPAAAARAGRARVVRRRRAVRSGTTVAVAVAAIASYAATGPATAPAAASVSCYADRVVASRRVDVGRGGVRLDVTNATAAAVRVVAGDETAIVPPGRTMLEVAVRPGLVEVGCESGAGEVREVTLTVTDRHHRFVDDALDCARPTVRAFHGTGDVVYGDPVALTSAHIGGAVPAGAVVEPAGYQASSGPRRIVRVRVSTHIVGVAVWHAMPSPRTWTLDELRLCPPDFAASP